MTLPAVPIPSYPTNPSGGSGSLSTYYNLPDNLATGDPLPASAIDLWINTVDNNLAAALAGIGAGTLAGGTWGTPAGLTVPVTEWRGILPNSSARVGYAGALTAAQTLTVPASVNFVVWAVPLAGTYPDGTAYETGASGQAQLEVVTDGSTPDGGTELFGGTAGASTLSGLADLRNTVGTAALAAALAALTGQEASDVAAIHAAIGSIYFGATPPADIADRLTALESAVAGTPVSGVPGGGTTTVTTAGTVYWNGLTRASNDSTTISQYVQSQLPTIPTPATPAALTDDVVVVDLLKSGIGLIYLSGNSNLTDTWENAFFCVPGLTSDTATIDLAHTTAPISDMAHTFG